MFSCFAFIDFSSRSVWYCFGLFVSCLQSCFDFYLKYVWFKFGICLILFIWNVFDFTHLFKPVDSKHETWLFLVSFVYFLHALFFWIPSPISGVIYVWWLYWILWWEAWNDTGLWIHGKRDSERPSIQLEWGLHHVDSLITTVLGAKARDLYWFSMRYWLPSHWFWWENHSPRN